MKKKLSTRIFSIFLSLLMVLSILPAGALTASAAEEQYALWFMNDMKFTQAPGGGFSHKGTQNFDVVGSSNHNIFAPFDCKIVAIYKGEIYGNTVIIESTNKVHYANGTYNYMSMAFAHDNNISDLSVGKKIKQGEVFYQTGTYGKVEGRHSHVTCIKGKYKYDMWTCNKYGFYCSPNAINPVDALYKQSTTKVINSAGLSFKTYSKDLLKTATPKITSNVSGDIALDSNVTITWSKVSNATGYIVKANGKEVQKNNSTKYAFKADKAQKYEITVTAYNSAGNSSASNKITVTAKKPSTVIFKDYDGTELITQSVKFGAAAISPETPSREGYTFDGWDGSYSRVTQDLTLTATYKINTYTVKFTDKDGKILSTQKVKYGEEAIPPEDKNIPVGYAFLGWSNEEYKAVKGDLTIQGIYSWGNTALPIVANITSAVRQDDGYYVYFDLANYPDAVTRGRAVVSLKTADGKLVDATESAAFSIPKNGTKTGMEVFIPCDKAATTAEVVIVNSYSSGVPISEITSSVIDQGLAWSEWSTEMAEIDENTQVESRTEYRFREKEISTANTKTKDGWIWDGTSSSTTGSWSAWSWNSVSPYSNESEKREVQTQSAVKSTSSKTVYKYFRYSSSQHALWGNYYKNSSYPNIYRIQTNSSLTYKGVDSDKSKNSNAKYYYQKCSCSNGYHYWYSDNGDLSSNGKVTTTTNNYATQYRYRDTKYMYNFYRWKEWGEWTEWVDYPLSSDSNREVETRTVYRYKSNEVGLEDTSGELRTISGKLEDSAYAGRQATLFIYKVDEASDYSNEYVAQTTIGEDGSYSFTYKLREEPTVKTGDFTVALGIEGTTNTIIIDTIEAPKPEYVVNFYDYNGNIISTQTVREGDSAIVPDAEVREGYTFTHWDSNTTNIKDNMDIYPVYLQNQYNVVFVNWETDTVEVKQFLYGEPIVAPDVEPKEGYNLTGWEGIGNGTVATDNMIVTATYDKEKYDVNFFDFDGNVISTQSVEYGESAELPEDLEAKNVIFLGWSSEEDDDYTEVKNNMDLYPQYIFEETTANPTADIKTGVYNDKQTVALSCDTENSVIYYTTDGSDPADNGVLYTTPITISQTCQLRFIASTFEMNDSLEVSEYYCINNSDIPSEWFSYEELPQSVINNFDSYTMETDTGYKYKDIQQVSDINSANQLRADGWLYNESKYTDYTDWQDTPIEIDDTKPGFEVDTRETEDNTVTRYQYSHYEYTDEDGNVQYSKNSVDGYDCTYKQIILDNNLSIAGFETIDGVRTSYYNHDNQKWYSQTRVNGMKTQYRSRYQIDEYYKWTNWTIDIPASTEIREYVSEDVYRYFNKNHYIVTIGNMELNSDVLLVQENQTIDVSKYTDVIGYNFAGLYLDPEFSNEFDLSAPVTESLTLYAKYTPKSYNVLFQMEDGTELDMQTVEYLQSATAPDTDVVPGYVFGGWDKEFDCITEDTVITGKYFKESEYTRVALSKSNATLVTGSTFNLTASITPGNLTDEEIEWSSSDPSVATVDENGKVTAISQGTAVITCIAVKTKEYASCTVKVLADDSNFIILSTDSSLNYDSLGYLRRIALKTSVETASKEFTNDNLKFFNISGTELTSTDYIGTGTQVKLFNGSNVVDTKTVVVTGDMTGDGIINNRDVAMMNKKLIDKADAEECQMLAIDVNGDGYVNNKDAAMVARYLVGKDAF